MKMRICGKEKFTSKDGRAFHKLTVLEPMSRRSAENGGVGLSATEYFVEPEVFAKVDDKRILALAEFDIAFGVSNGRAVIEDVQ